MTTKLRAVDPIDFLSRCNGKCKERTFSESDYDNFVSAVRKARRAAKARKPFYSEDTTGGVANSYRYSTTTARWYCWSLPDGSIEYGYGRVTVGGPHVSKAYHMGERAYRRHFADNDVEKLTAKGS